MPLDFIAAGVLPALSPARFARYQAATTNNLAASELYEWNSRVSADYLELLSWVEVALRNASHDRLTSLARARGQTRWDRTDAAWFSPWFQQETVRQIRQARARASGGPAVDPPVGKVVAELSLGFWVRLYSRGYEASLWTPALRHSFPSGLSRRHVQNELVALNKLRNRVAHHEAIFDGAHNSWLASISLVLGWLSPPPCAHVVPQSRVHASLVSMRAACV